MALRNPPSSSRAARVLAQPILSDDLSFEPWWWQAAPRRAEAPEHGGGAPLPGWCDVAIVGAGFTGLSAALVLARAGRNVLVLDAGPIGAGASSRNGGMIGSGHRVGFAELEARYGRPTAEAIIREGLTSLDFTAELIEREQIACSFRRSGRFRGAWRPADYEAFGREIDFMAKTFGVEAAMVPRAEQHREVSSEAYHGGCLYLSHGGLHPGLFHQGLLERAVSAGATVLGSRPVTAIAREGEAFRLDVAGAPLVAREVIVATNGYSGRASPWHSRRLIPVPSYIIATEPLGRERVASLIPGGRMIVESRSRHCYYRPSPDGERILFGGRASVAPIALAEAARRLHRLMVGLFPSLADTRVTHAWTGNVAFSRDRLPHLGAHKGLHYALGYGGSGVAMAPYLGYKIAQLLLGRPEGRSPFAELPFKPFLLYDGRPWFLPLVEAKTRLADWREGGG